MTPPKKFSTMNHFGLDREQGTRMETLIGALKNPFVGKNRCTKGERKREDFLLLIFFCFVLFCYFLLEINKAMNKKVGCKSRLHI